MHALEHTICSSTFCSILCQFLANKTTAAANINEAIH